MDERIARIRRAMEANRCDNLERATRAFSSLSPDEMREQYGHSGETRQQILDGYKQDRAEWHAAWELLVRVLPEIGYPK